MTEKPYLSFVKEIKPLAQGHGACFATDRVSIEGYPVRFMYREEPDNDIDSGWRFLSGLEDDEYMDDPNNHAIFDVNTIANHDPSIIPYLNSPVGSAFEKASDSLQFVEVTDWNPIDDS